MFDKCGSAEELNVVSGERAHRRVGTDTDRQNRLRRWLLNSWMLSMEAFPSVL